MARDHEEFIAAGPHTDIRRAKRLAHRVGESAKGEIALLVAERVVDVLEAIHIDRDDAVGLAMTDGERMHQPELLGEEVTIVETRQAVGRRLPLGRLEHTPRREAEGDAVRGGAQDGHIEDRLLIGFEEERTHGVAAGDEGHA